jgi:hypothetical protein
LLPGVVTHIRSLLNVQVIKHAYHQRCSYAHVHTCETCEGSVRLRGIPTGELAGMDQAGASSRAGGVGTPRKIPVRHFLWPSNISTSAAERTRSGDERQGKKIGTRK